MNYVFCFADATYLSSLLRRRWSLRIPTILSMSASPEASFRRSSSAMESLSRSSFTARAKRPFGSAGFGLVGNFGILCLAFDFPFSLGLESKGSITSVLNRRWARDDIGTTRSTGLAASAQASARAIFSSESPSTYPHFFSSCNFLSRRSFDINSRESSLDMFFASDSSTSESRSQPLSSSIARLT